MVATCKGDVGRKKASLASRSLSAPPVRGRLLFSGRCGVADRGEIDWRLPRPPERLSDMAIVLLGVAPYLVVYMVEYVPPGPHHLVDEGE